MPEIVFCLRSSNDREDFIEDRIQLSELVKRDIDFTLFKGGMVVKDKVLIGHGIRRDLLAHEPLWPRYKQQKKINNYHETETFKGFCRRKFTVAPFTEEGIELAVKEIGAHSVLVKYAGAQKITSLFKLNTESPVKEQIMEEIGWEMVRVGGPDRRVIVQEEIQMLNEYRIFVIDGRPVTGAGCIDLYTPLENKTPFDPKMQKIRREGIPYSDQSLANLYMNLAACEICPSFEREGIKDYTLDLFQTSTGEIGIVEINPAYNAGFYANDYPALLTAILESCE